MERDFVLHADNHLVVVDKPAGLPSVPGRTPELQDCAASRVQALWPDAMVVHRLDMATSGLLVLARGAEVQRSLSAAFASRTVHKRYVGLVAGEPSQDAGEIDLPIGAHWPDRPRRRVDTVSGKPSLTRWRVLQREGGRARLELEPVTGRTHQLRVHLAAIGHPLMGDTLYAPESVQAAAPRLMLHARQLRLPHPTDGALRTFDSPPPF